MAAPTLLPAPPADPDAATAWVAAHLEDLVEGPVRASEAIRGGQGAADAAVDGFDVTGYATRRSEVDPGRRGASRLSPYVRHGLLTLPRLWRHVGGGPYRDREKYREELLWQEYARHLYARLGRGTARSLRYEQARAREPWPYDDPWPRRMACMDLVRDELERDGWLVNQTRMWVASQWSVRAGVDWQVGEEHLYRRLLDGSRAANRLGWQWTAGAGTGRPYGFARQQVERRAPGLCGRCALRDACPVQDFPDAPQGARVADPDPRLDRDDDVERTAGPAEVVTTGRPAAVWLTAESLGDEDPALAAHPDLPVVFVLDAPLLARLRLAAPRLVFLAESLGDLAARRDVAVHLGDPVGVLAGQALATTAAPVPGWRRRAAALQPVEVHPWPWLVRPGSGSLRSYSSWQRAAGAVRPPARRGRARSR